MMDEALLKSGQWPNVAVRAGTDPARAMEDHGVDGPTDCLRDAAWRNERRIAELERTLRSMWRDMDVARMRCLLPDDLVDGWRVRLHEKGVEVE